MSDVRARIGVVLAGGRATRMGGDKAGALLGGRSLLEHAVELVVTAGLESRVCARDSTLLPPLATVSADDVWREPGADGDVDDPRSAHPLAGVAHALERAGEPVVVLPVDLPLLPAAVLRGLAMHPAPSVVLARDGRPAALVAKLDPSVAPTLAAAALAGAPALRTLLDAGAALVELASLVPVDRSEAEHALTNVNDAADLAAVAAVLRRR